MGTIGLRWRVASVALVVSAFIPALASAAPFAFVGPRATGMGGAGVAATEDAQAIYWNPAGLTLGSELDITLSGTVRAAVDRDLDDAIDNIKHGLGNLNPERVEQILNQIDDNASGGTNGGGGIFAKYVWDQNAWGLAFLDVFNGTANVPVIIPAVINIGGKLFNPSVVSLNGLEGRQIAASYARSFYDNLLSLGFTTSALEGVVYANRSFVQKGDTGFDLSPAYTETRSDWEPSIDAGATYNPTSWLRFAVVGKYLNRPTFDVINEDTIKINGTPPNIPPELLNQVRQRLKEAQSRFQLAPQGRASVAAYPIDGMTLTADVDVTENPTFVKNANSQIMSVGGEQLFFDKILAGRLGVYYDFQLPNADPVPTIGVGVDVYGFNLGVSGAYDFDESAGALAVGLGYHM